MNRLGYPGPGKIARMTCILKSLGKGVLPGMIPTYLRRAFRCAILAGALSGISSQGSLNDPSGQAGSMPTKFPISPRDEVFLRDLCQCIYRYFEEQSNPETGLVLDRARNDGSPHGEPVPASIAATGFGLTALCLAPDSAGMDTDKARARVRATLRFFWEKAPQVHGWFYHFMDSATGARSWQCEVSSIDTALLVAGILTARERFADDVEIRRLATAIYQRIDFPWMLNGDPYLLSHGWKPETGFLNNRWDTYSEDTILYLLAIGSPRHPIPPAAWYAWKRTAITYDGYTYISGGPLFTHQYAHAWVDYRGRQDRRSPYLDYFTNSIAASRANRAFCIDLSRQFPGYSADIWGITASDSARGYVAWGGPPLGRELDGTVVPCAAGGSLMFAPDICLPALRAMREKFAGKIWGRYGFVDAFNPNTGWFDPDVIAIDLGITLLSAENLRDEGVWRWFMRNAEIRSALDLAGLEAKGTAK